MLDYLKINICSCNFHESFHSSFHDQRSLAPCFVFIFFHCLIEKYFSTINVVCRAFVSKHIKLLENCWIEWKSCFIVWFLIFQFFCHLRNRKNHSLFHRAWYVALFSLESQSLQSVEFFTMSVASVGSAQKPRDDSHQIISFCANRCYVASTLSHMIYVSNTVKHHTRSRQLLDDVISKFSKPTSNIIFYFNHALLRWDFSITNSTFCLICKHPKGEKMEEKTEPKGKHNMTTLINKTMMKAPRQIPFCRSKISWHFTFCATNGTSELVINNLIRNY